MKHSHYFLTALVIRLMVSSEVFGADVSIDWLDHSAPGAATGVSFGVPWPQGAVKKDPTFSLRAADGKTLPLQTWPLAYWPDGSLKWSGLATATGAGVAGPFILSSGTSAATDGAKLTLQQSNGVIEIDTGAMKARLLTTGKNLIESLAVGGREVARAGQLVCILQSGPDVEEGAMPRAINF